MKGQFHQSIHVMKVKTHKVQLGSIVNLIQTKSMKIIGISQNRVKKDLNISWNLS
jgi:hypothetical protein